jgi:putative solute:sodium symporter small subunit
MADTSGGVRPAARPGSKMSDRSEGYWRANLKVKLPLLITWAIFGYVLAILLAEPLNNVTFIGFPLGFWFAQQGAIVVFVALIFIYARRMDRVDEEFDVHEEELGSARKRAEKRVQRGERA